MITTAKTHNRIREVRMAKGISQSELGRRIGLSEPAINRYESGSRKPNRKTLNDIAQVLGVPLKSLFVNLDNPVVVAEVEVDDELDNDERGYDGRHGGNGEWL